MNSLKEVENKELLHIISKGFEGFCQGVSSKGVLKSGIKQHQRLSPFCQNFGKLSRKLV